MTQSTHPIVNRLRSDQISKVGIAPEPFTKAIAYKCRAPTRALICMAIIIAANVRAMIIFSFFTAFVRCLFNRNLKRLTPSLIPQVENRGKSYVDVRRQR